MKVTKSYLKQIIIEQLKAISGAGEGTGAPQGKLSSIAGGGESKQSEKAASFIKRIENIKNSKNQFLQKLSTAKKQLKTLFSGTGEIRQVPNKQELQETMLFLNDVEAVLYPLRAILNDYQDPERLKDISKNDQERIKLKVENEIFDPRFFKIQKNISLQNTTHSIELLNYELLKWLFEKQDLNKEVLSAFRKNRHWFMKYVKTQPKLKLKLSPEERI